MCALSYFRTLSLALLVGGGTKRTRTFAVCVAAGAVLQGRLGLEVIEDRSLALLGSSSSGVLGGIQGGDGITELLGNLFPCDIVTDLVPAAGFGILSDESTDDNRTL